jgi:hypothetical protein
LTVRFAAHVWSRPLEPGIGRDAAAVRLPAPGDADGAVRLAVADGASGTLHSGRWAAALVAAAVEDWVRISPESLTDRLETLRSGFDPMAREPRPTPLRAEKWQLYGSQSTLLAVSVSRRRGRIAVEAVGVGDSVLVLLGRTSWRVVPQMAARDFTATPQLVKSTAGAVQDFFHWSGSAPRDTVVLLATDGAAQPLLGTLERDGPVEARALLADVLALPPDGSVALGPGNPPTTSRARTFLATLHDDATVVTLADAPDIAGLTDAELVLAALVDAPDAVDPRETAPDESVP